MRLNLHLLGPPEVRLDGKLAVGFGSNKVRALLFYLAVQADNPHRRESLAGLLWPDYPERSARTNLSNALSNLRTVLGDRESDAPCFHIFRETIQFNTHSDHRVDVTAFEAMIARQQWQEAVDTYRGPFLEGFSIADSPAFEQWALVQRERMQRKMVVALEGLSAHHEEEGDFTQAVEVAQHWLEFDPLQEAAHRQLMHLYVQSGRRNAALRQYRACVRVLEQELDVSPSDETTALYERIRADRSHLAARVTVAPLPSSSPVSPIIGQEESIKVGGGVFVARERELAELDSYLKAALAGRGQVALVAGEAGSGKTTLLYEFARRAQRDCAGLAVASGQCNAYTGPGDPYLPFREILGLLSGDLDTGLAQGIVTQENAQRLQSLLSVAVQTLLDLGHNLIGTLIPVGPLIARATALEPFQADWVEQLERIRERQTGRDAGLGAAQSELFEQVSNVLGVLARQRPLLLLIDDAQWADVASIDLLFHLGRRLTGKCILIAVAYRSEEVALGHPLAGTGQGERHPLEAVINELTRTFGSITVNLDQAMERGFIDALLDVEPNQLGPDFRDALYHHTQGHALFTVELLRDLQERGDILRDDAGRWAAATSLNWEALPARVEAVIVERIGRVESDLRDILDVASVEGERFTAQVVAQVQDLPERETLRSLSQGLEKRHRLVRLGAEVRADGRFLSRCQFAHVLFQQYLYHRLSAGERRLLHGEVAQALEELHGEQRHTIAVQLAHHYDAAGQVGKAVEYLVLAGEQARLAYANERAIDCYRRALALMDGLAPDADRNKSQLTALSGLGKVLFGMGKILEAEEPLQAAITLGKDEGLAAPELVRLYAWLAEVMAWQGRRDDMVRLAEQGLVHLGDHTESVEAALMNQFIAVGSGQGSQEYLDRMSRIAQYIERLPYEEQLRPVYNHILLTYSMYRELDQVLKWIAIVEQRASRHRDLRALAMTHLCTGCTQRHRGDLYGSISPLRQSIELYTRIGDIKHRAEPRRILATAFLWMGDLERARFYANRAVEDGELAGGTFYLSDASRTLGQVLLCQGEWQQAAGLFAKACDLGQQDPVWAPWQFHAGLQGYALLAGGKHQAAVRQFVEAIAAVKALPMAEPIAFYNLCWAPDPPQFAFLLNGLEEAYGNPQAFRETCHRIRGEHPDRPDLLLQQWYLEPVDAGMGPGRQVQELSLQSPDWTWVDPLGDCSYVVEHGLEIHAVNGRDLWFMNWSAPRFTRMQAGDLAIQTVCSPVSNDKPAIGGLVLWKDEKNYLHLDWGAFGRHAITFMGCMDNQDIAIGRGRLYEEFERVYLRLERVGDRVNALCSADGEEWYTVGQVVFPVQDPVQVGAHAIGNINRTIYHGAYPEGAAICFESFQMWEL